MKTSSLNFMEKFASNENTNKFDHSLGSLKYKDCNHEKNISTKQYRA